MMRRNEAQVRMTSGNVKMNQQKRPKDRMKNDEHQSAQAQILGAHSAWIGVTRVTR